MQKLRTHIWLILSLVIAIWAGRMLLTSSHFYTHDDIQVIRVSEFVGCLKSRQIPCRWAPHLGKGYGYPWFNYYPPMIYVVPSILHLSGLPIITSLNLFNFATFILAAWAMYCLVNTLFKRPSIAFLGSILYTLYPFHASNVFVRGVMAENLAWSFAPLLLHLVYRQIKDDKWERWLPLGIAFLFLTHVISTFVLAGITVVWTISIGILLKKRSIVHIFSRLTLQVLIGLGIAAFFFVPALVEKSLVQSESLTQGYYAHTNHYVSFYQLFVEHKWNYSASLWSEAWDEMPFMVGHIHTILFVFLLAIIGYLRPEKSTYRLLFASIVALLSLSLLFLSHFKSDFIWSLIPSMAYIQFPWRFIVWAGLPLTIALSALLSLVPAQVTRILLVVITTSLVVYSYPFFFPRGYDSYVDADYLPGGSEYREQQVKSFYDYLPKTVQVPPTVYADESSAQFPIFYFPGWSANVQIIADPVNGLITPTNPDSRGIILKWQETPFRLSMDILSLLTLALYVIYLVRSHVQ